MSTLTDGLFTYEKIFNAPKPCALAIRTWFQRKKFLVCENHFLYINVWIQNPLAKIHSQPFVVIRENLRSSKLVWFQLTLQFHSPVRCTLWRKTNLVSVQIYALKLGWKTPFPILTTKTFAVASFELWRYILFFIETDPMSEKCSMTLPKYSSLYFSFFHPTMTYFLKKLRLTTFEDIMHHTLRQSISSALR